MTSYSWEDIFSLDEKLLQERLMRASESLVALALIGESIAHTKKILRNVSRRRQEEIAAEMQANSDVGRLSVKHARRGLLKIIFQIKTDDEKDSATEDNKVAKASRPLHEKEEPEERDLQKALDRIQEGRRVMSGLKEISPFLQQLEAAHDGESARTLIDTYFRGVTQKRGHKWGATKISENQAEQIVRAFRKKLGEKQ